jgi:hypothetical protein
MSAAPIIVTALFGDADFAKLDALRRLHYPPERNQVPAHLTLFAHLPPSLEQELGRRLAAATTTAPPRARLAGVIDLGAGTALRVESERLEALRDDLADAFHFLLAMQDSGPWHPHVTIQNKVEPREARALQARLRAGFAPEPLTIAGLASWRYLGGPWQAIRRYPFRGARV